MDRELDEPASAEEPLLTDEERTVDGGDQRIPWEPPRSGYLGSKVKYFRRLQKDWVSLSPPTKAAKPPSDFSDFGDLMQYHFGKRAQAVTVSVSVFVLMGACIAYHVLMKQCAFTAFHAAFDWLGVHVHWTPSAAALFVCLLFPLTNVKEFATLVRFNSLGIPFLLFTIVFITYHGVHAVATHAPMDDIAFGAKSTFGVLGGIVTLSFFIHNAIQPIIRHSNPANYARDVTAAYVLVGMSYITVGVLGYIGFPTGVPIQQNFLDAFPAKYANDIYHFWDVVEYISVVLMDTLSRDVFAFAARMSLLLQLATVYPLFFVIIRTQVFGLVFQNTWPSAWRVVLLNLGIMATTTAFAVYYPHVGDILRFTGAAGGLVLIFIAPIGLHWKQQRAQRLWTWGSMLVHVAIVLVGVTLLVLQFV
ncbi:hypothetical protein DYB30_004491 [Aphanomyces astaci]|uniref:Amino acid transporter transmembrane domain-containing protein n=2 Tax=Aphanomyces astaci TaxID=112090 RepID=A0A397AKF0_APHAT|nr:hypothetical protein DYB36_003377 [Aphanomyces astaci]RHY66455.1 hypothetical protein DYB30_004491 [Aphanomyces astaci]